MTDTSGLLAAARLLLGENNKGAPHQARLRRAVSAAYYALFHAIARAATDAAIGARHRKAPRYEIFYRGFEHRRMREGCEAVDKPTMKPKYQQAFGQATVSQELRDVANAFVNLQKWRHWADYSPSGKMTRSQARDLVDLAEFGVKQLVAAEPEPRKNFLVLLMIAARDA